MRVAMRSSDYLRYYSPYEIEALAERVAKLVERNRTVHLTPATGWLVERALRAHAARPTRDAIAEIICGNRQGCSQRCMTRVGKANVIVRLFAGEPATVLSLNE